MQFGMTFAHCSFQPSIDRPRGARKMTALEENGRRQAARCWGMARR